MKLRARWTGPLPRIGDYLMSPMRPRYAYRVSGVVRDPHVLWNAEHKTEIRRLAIEVDRIPLSEVETSARVHPWRWDKRHRAVR